MKTSTAVEAPTPVITATADAANVIAPNVASARNTTKPISTVTTVDQELTVVAVFGEVQGQSELWLGIKLSTKNKKYKNKVRIQYLMEMTSEVEGKTSTLPGMYTLTTRYDPFASDMIAHTLENIMFVETKTKQRGKVKTTMHTKFPLDPKVMQMLTDEVKQLQEARREPSGSDESDDSADSSPSTAEHTTGETAPGSDFDNAGTMLGPDEDGRSNTTDIPQPKADHQNNGKTNNSADSTTSAARQTKEGAALASAVDNAGTVLGSHEDGKSTSLDIQTPSNEKKSNNADSSPSTAENTTDEDEDSTSLAWGRPEGGGRQAWHVPTPSSDNSADSIPDAAKQTTEGAALASAFDSVGTVLGQDEEDKSSSGDIPLTSEKRRNSEETNNSVTGLTTLDSLENGSPTHARTGAN